MRAPKVIALTVAMGNGHLVFGEYLVGYFGRAGRGQKTRRGLEEASRFEFTHSIPSRVLQKAYGRTETAVENS